MHFSLTTVVLDYNLVLMSQNPHKSQPIARPLGRAMGWLLWFRIWFIFCLRRCAVMYTISHNTGLHYNGTWLPFCILHSSDEGKYFLKGLNSQKTNHTLTLIGELWSVSCEYFAEMNYHYHVVMKFYYLSSWIEQNDIKLHKTSNRVTSPLQWSNYIFIDEPHVLSIWANISLKLSSSWQKIVTDTMHRALLEISNYELILSD